MKPSEKQNKYQLQNYGKSTERQNLKHYVHREIPFVITHNPRNHNIVNTTKNCFPVLQQSRNLKEIIQQKDIIYCRKQPPNLKKLLTKAKFTSEKEISTVSKCQDLRCGTCDFLQTGTSTTFKNGITFNVHSNMNCKTKNVIYCMTCDGCGENYIGQTGNKVSDRVRVHKQQIRDPSVRNTACSEHFDVCGRGQFKIFPFYKVKEESEQLRRAKEQYFISKFKPKLNR